MKRWISIGVIFGLLAGVLWSVDTTILGVVGGDASVADIAAKVLVYTFAATFIHDFFSAMWMWIYMISRKNLGNTLRKFKTRSGCFVVLGALLGGPIGMTGYVLAINNIGASYTTAISALFPALGAFFAFIVLRDKLTLFNWFGLALSIASVILLGGALAFEGNNAILGVVCAIICVLGWSLESTICAYGMKDGEITPYESTLVRQTTSAIVFGAILIPLLSSHSYTVQIVQTNMIWLLLLAAFVGTLSYMFYYKAIKTIGPVRGTSTNITYVAWTFVISWVFLDGEFTIKSMILSFLILVGSIITVIKKEEPIQNNSKESMPQLSTVNE